MKNTNNAIKDLVHVSDTSSVGFADELLDEVSKMQDKGLVVEIQHSVGNVWYSAIVIGREK